MKDLWADLLVDGDDDGDINFSLEQLERELAHLDECDYAATVPTAFAAAAPSPFAPLGSSAASMIVSQQAPATPVMPGNEDAWQQSLEKFTAMSLEQDFLAADSARKVKPGPAPPGFMAEAEDYNVTEAIPAVPPGLAGPPGYLSGTPSKATPATPRSIMVSTPQTPSNSMVLPEEEAPQIPRGEPVTPYNSVAIIEDDDDEDEPIIVQPGLTIHEEEPKQEAPKQEAPQQQQEPPANAWGAGPQGMMQGMPPQGMMMPPQGMHPQGMMPPQGMHPQGMHPQQGMPPQGMMPQGMHPHQGMRPQQGMPPQGMMPPQQGMPPQGMMSPQRMPPQGMMSPQRMPPQQGMPPQGMMSPQGMPPQQEMPMGIPVPQMMKQGTPWQSQPPPRPQPPQQPLYCMVQPSAPPIPATALESSFMKSRDVAYVLHSMLRPVLSKGSSPTDYDVQLLQRRSGQQTPAKKPKHAKIEKETKARSINSMQFMKEKSTLGHTTKTDVMRPRALLAVSAKKTTEEGESQEARASLWKARLYIDQGQEAATALRQIWQSSAPGSVPKQVQPHLLKLFKVLGLSFKDDVYSMDPTKDSLAVILKLSKGKTFVARLLEQALLPPKTVQVLVPAALKNALAGSNSGEAAADARLFGAIGRVLTMLPQWNPESLLVCLEAASSKQALTSQPRMECLHALLRRGNSIQDEEFVPQWKTAEAELMKLLS